MLSFCRNTCEHLLLLTDYRVSNPWVTLSSFSGGDCGKKGDKEGWEMVRGQEGSRRLANQQGSIKCLVGIVLVRGIHALES